MQIVKILFLLILSAVFHSPAAALDFAESHDKIQSLLSQRAYRRAADELEKMAAADKNTFVLNNYDYLLARIAETNEDLATAITNYQAVADRRSVLAGYALWHLAKIARSTGNLPLERMYLRELSLIAPADRDLLSEATRRRLARSHFESRDFPWAIAEFRADTEFPAPDVPVALPVKTSGDITGTLTGADAPDRENLVYLGRAYLLTGRADRARIVFEKLIETIPDPRRPDDFALAAVRGLDEIAVGRDEYGKAVPQLTAEKHLQRAHIYQFNRDFAHARLHYLALIARFTENSEVPTAMNQIGRGYSREKNFSKAADWFERIQAEFPDRPIAQEALYRTAGAYTRLNKPREAVSRYQKYIEQYPRADNLDRAYLNIVDTLRDQGSASRALQWTDKTSQKFTGELPEAVALFARVRIHLSRNDWTKALADLRTLQNFPRLGGTSVPGGTTQSEVRFLKGYVLEQLEQFGEATDVYLSIPDGRGLYYGWRATRRLAGLAEDPRVKGLFNEKKRKLAGDLTDPDPVARVRAAQFLLRLGVGQEYRAQLLKRIKQEYSELPRYAGLPDERLLGYGRRKIYSSRRPVADARHQTLADELLFLGLYDEGTPELDVALSESPGERNENQKYTLAVFYRRGDLANRAIAYIEPKWRKIPADFQIELIPRRQSRLLYPAPYRESLLRYAKPRGVDPRFVLAIMRQESRFRADVKSVAAARGLMQFISSTAREIAAETGRPHFRQDDLYHPPTAILFGSAYISNLFEMFPGQPEAVAASYNGGEDNMQRWLARSSANEPDRYVPEILYAQTKDYVFRVMQNYRMYRTLYDEELRFRQNIADR